MAVETQNRVQLAASHWKPRFVANGVDVNDFERALATVTEWKEWAPFWGDTGNVHRALADAAARDGRTVTATEAYQRAAWSYHLGKFLWFEDRGLHEDLARRTVEAYKMALPDLDPAGERVELAFEGSVIPGILRRPRDIARPALVLMVPGLDSVKEELFAMENDFLKRGMATLSVDGPGQGENERRFPIRPDWSGVVTAIIDGLRARDNLDLSRVGLMGISMGGIYGPFAAAKEKRLRALIALAGPYDLSECWPALNPLTKGGYVYYTHSHDEAEAFEKSKQLSLRGIIEKVDCPVLIIHGAKDRLFPPEQAERIAREAKDATLLMYPDGNHVCNNITYKYRPAMADWMKERLGA
ncbi:MAG: prolyl oligopeptidase family serine peptidase [Chloroflexota bacterium]|nr:prolyl oligopeptidase family serine peptidase [Chloroflexota bacterium]